MVLNPRPPASTVPDVVAPGNRAPLETPPVRIGSSPRPCICHFRVGPDEDLPYAFSVTTPGKDAQPGRTVVFHHEVDESGRLTAGVAFDVDDWCAASREAFARWFARDAVAAASVGPVLEYIEGVEQKRPDALITVVLPSVVPARWWHNLLHNQTAWFIKGALLFKKHVIVVTDVPHYLTQ